MKREFLTQFMERLIVPGMVISIRAETVGRPIEVEFHFNLYADVEIRL